MTRKLSSLGATPSHSTLWRGSPILFALTLACSLVAAPGSTWAQRAGDSEIEAPKRSQPPKVQRKKPARRTRPKRPTARKPSPPRRRSCVVLAVRVDKLNFQGVPWDPWREQKAYPDIQVSEANTDFVSHECKDTYSCQIRISRPPSTMRLTIMDLDPGQPDLIGSGNCSSSASSCRIGKASLRLSSC